MQPGGKFRFMIRRALYHGFSLVAEKKIRKLISDSKAPRAAQNDKLLGIIRANADSRFGKEHGFSHISSVTDFQKSVPVREYEQFRTYIDDAAAGQPSVLTSGDVVMFATTSGTAGKPKFIPITAGYIEEFRAASVVSGYNLLRAFPGIAAGVTLSIVSPAEEGRTSGGIPYGAISGQLFQHEPYLIKKFISPIPYEVFLISDYESKYYTLLRLALALPVSCFYTLNPSTLSLLCRRLGAYAHQLIKDVRDGTVTPPGAIPSAARKAVAPFFRPNPRHAAQLMSLLERGCFKPSEIWPQLAVVSCWTKAAASFYLADFPEQFGQVPICDITYGASEGRGTVFMGPGKQMLALQSHFFEFIPEDEIEHSKPTVLLADELEVGKSYFILFTTSGGLYRYNINDVVKVTGFFNGTPMIEFQYKGGNVCSFTGEKITEFQVTTALTRCIARLGIRVRFFTVVPVFRPEPHYEIWIEAETHEEKMDALAYAFDEELSDLNIEYEAKRASGRLSSVKLRALKTGAYEDFRKHLVAFGTPDAQIKISHLNPKTEVREFLERAIKHEVGSKVLSGR